MVLTTINVKELLKRGKSVIDIAKEFNLTRQAIYYHIEKIKREEEPRKETRKVKKDYNSLIDWRLYNEGLVKRGEVLVDLEIFKGWEEELDLMNKDKYGRPYEYPESFIEFILRFKSIFKIDYRSLEGISRKLIIFIKGARKAPDYTTLQIRFSEIDCRIEVYEGSGLEQEIACDSSGLKTNNRGEYRMSKYRGKKKEYVKIHIAVNTKTRQVVSCEVEKEGVRDHEEMDKLILGAEKRGKIKKALFDAGYDCKEKYLELEKKGIKGVIRPRKTMKLERVIDEIEGEKRNERETLDEGKKEKIKARLLRLENLKRYLEDEDKWKEENGYGQRWKAESRYSVFKRIFGEHLFSKGIKNQKKEAIIKVNLMNLFTSFTIGAIDKEVRFAPA